MAWTTPATAVAGSTTLTAAFWNEQVRDNLTALPRGVLLHTTSTSAFATSATHTTYQDTGLSGSVSYEADRRLLIQVVVNPYTSGGLQNVRFQVLRGATVVMMFQIIGECLSATGAGTFTFCSIVNSPITAGTETFKIQMKAASANTAVNDFGGTTGGDTFTRELSVIDLGPA